ncbi:MAG: DUF4007 family protein [bacterium]|nr:DUF4007 family protein [Candidatus Limimorpha equi]
MCNFEAFFISIMGVNCTFSGHETFHCKSLWLKKGYDFVTAGRAFNDNDAVVELGVGKNMVASIRYWLRAFGIIDSRGEITDIGHYIFGDNGCDPYLEDVNTLWLLHYLLLSTGYAVLYKQVFLNLHKERQTFTKANIQSFIKRKIDDHAFAGIQYNETTITRDIGVLLKNYVVPDGKTYEDFTAILLDLNLISKIDDDSYGFNYKTKADLNPIIFLYAVKDVAGDETIVDFDKLLNLGLQFCLTQNDLYEIFRQLNKIDPSISFSNVAGELLFTISENLDKTEILNMYYNNR